MDEPTAKTKWCPMARMAGGHNAFNQDADGRPMSKCIASGCMMWRKDGMDEDDTGRIVDSGYCGLGGKPRSGW